MKNLILSLLLTSLSAFVFGQSVTLTPTGDEILIQTYGSLGGSFYGRNAGGTDIKPTATTINSSLTLLGARGHNGTGYPISSQGLIGIYANQNFSNTALGTHIRFETTDDNTTTRIERMRITPNGNVGIGTPSPPAKLTVVGDFALRKIQRETSSGGFNDYDRQDASIAFFENGGSLGGIAGGSEGQMLYVVSGYGNAQSSLIIRHDSPSNPTATNRILTHTGADFTISSGLGGVLLIYDATKARWRIVETPSSSGTAGWGLTGNTGTNPSTQFIGTADAQPLAFKTNNVERMRVLSDGNIGIGTATPNAKLSINGDISLAKKSLVFSSSATYDPFDRENKSFISLDASTTNLTNTIKGFTAPVSGSATHGTLLYLYVGFGQTVILKNVSSTIAANEIRTNTGTDITIVGRGGAILIYDVDSWKLLSVSQ